MPVRMLSTRTLRPCTGGCSGPAGDASNWASVGAVPAGAVPLCEATHLIRFTSSDSLEQNGCYVILAEVEPEADGPDWLLRALGWRPHECPPGVKGEILETSTAGYHSMNYGSTEHVPLRHNVEQAYRAGSGTGVGEDESQPVSSSMRAARHHQAMPSALVSTAPRALDALRL